MSIVTENFDCGIRYTYRKDCTNTTRHKWANDVCTKCGITRKKEYDQQEIKFLTRYYDKDGRFISRRVPECMQK